MTDPVLRWADCNAGWLVCRSTCLAYQCIRLASPEGHFMAEHRPSLFDRISIGPARSTLAEAQQDAEDDRQALHTGQPRYCDPKVAA